MDSKDLGKWNYSELNNVAEFLKKHPKDEDFKIFININEGAGYPYNVPLRKIVLNWYRNSDGKGKWLRLLAAGVSEDDITQEISLYFLERGFSDWKAGVKFTAWFTGTLRQHGLIGRRIQKRWQRIRTDGANPEFFSIEGTREESEKGVSILDRDLAERRQDMELPVSIKELGAEYGLTASETFILIKSYDFQKEGKSTLALKKYLVKKVPKEMRSIKTAKNMEALIQYLRQKAKE